ncbi:hypothetical protein [Halobacillus aidingensis]|uniref:hypothetical protein n=1 Tax=Halobacillus aidingensis TaxID=240303 RepID=UPI000B7F004A|nr:hypothetical protein [Halobacillus aidingensis]
MDICCSKTRNKQNRSTRRKKAKEVREENLPYVGDEFYIHIVNEEYFSKELNTLIQSTSNQLHIAHQQVDHHEVDKWIEDDSDNLLTLLSSKIEKLPTLDNEEKLNAFRFEMIKKYIGGQNTLFDLQNNHPYLYEIVDRCKASYENQLAFEGLMSLDDNSKKLTNTMENYKTNLQEEAKSLSNQTIDTLKFEAISDWLIRCPLNFY